MLSELGKRILLFDGGMGTQLQAAGLAAGELPENWNLLHPEVVCAIHERYLRAGSDIVTTNTFGANRARLGDEVRPVVEAAVKLAKQAVTKVGHGMVALDIGPTGSLLCPMGELPFEDAVSLFRETAEIGAAAGAELVIIETMADPYEMKAAVLGVKEGCNLPIFATMTADGEGKLLTGGTIEALAVLLDSMGVTALGLNCGLGGEQMIPLVARLRAVTSLPILVQPNAGLPILQSSVTVYPDDPATFAGYARQLAASGAWLLGGCCGTTPAHIMALKQAVGDMTPLSAREQKGQWISSGIRAVNLCDKPIIVGERINPTGKKAMKEALRSGDMNWILREAVRQTDSGAHALDVNVGLPGIDEAAFMERAVTGVQSVSPLPVQIDSADAAALERGLRCVNGKALVNSVSGRKDVLDAVLPLVKKYGGMVVGLLLDEEGIPETVEGRVDIARRIVKRCEEEGIPRRDILLDALTMTVSTGADNGKITLETLRRVKAELGVGTILGVSNVSFGLPERPRLTGAFLTLAIEAGLDAAIANPLSEPLMDSYICALSLCGYDAGCVGYVGRFGGEQAAPAASARATLEEAVYQGLEKDAAEGAKTLLAEGVKPLDIIESKMLPALTRVGDDYEKGIMFLPQLVMAAQAAQGAFAVLEEALLAGGEKRESAGSIALATVEGDVHDIGKNIVKVLLSSYGFDVIDLGRNVSADKVVATIREHGLRVVGLSALMTTTVPAMEKTIALIRRETPACRVVVGGAVLTESLARDIGADAYAPDAMATVRFAREVCQGT